MLRHGGHDTGVFVVDKDLSSTVDRLAAYKPDAVAFSVISGSHKGYYAISAAVKDRLGVPVIWGGPHATFFPEVVQTPYADAACVGEGEEAMLQFADRFEAEGRKLPTDAPNFWIKREGEIFKNPVIARNRALDALPYAARDLYYEQFPVLRNHGIKHFLAHRGCPYKCTYCFNESYNTIYREQAGDKKVFASRSPDSIVDEILWLKERVPLKMVAFVDDVFTLHRRWTMEFAEVYAKRCRIPFSCNTRFDNVDNEMVEALSEAGLRLVYAGVEAGNEFIRNTVMKRQMTEQSMYDTAALYKKHGVKLLTENVLGAPGETFETALETLKINIKAKPDVANASIFAPYPKLEMTQFAIDHGYFDGNFDSLNDNYYHGSVLKFKSELDKWRILNLRCFFSFVAHHPRWLPVIKPLLGLKPNAAFRWFGDLVDGYYLKRCMAYKLSFSEFLTTLRHFLTNYRQGSSAGRTAEARQSVATAAPGVRIDKTQSPYCG